MKKNITMALFLMAILLLSNITQAEPTTNIKYLMNNFVSMLDWGAYRLEIALRDIDTIKHKNAFLHVNYDQEKNRLIISVQDKVPSSTTELEAKKWCREVIEEIKSYLGINYRTGKPFRYKMKNSDLYLYFGHEGFVKKSQPQDLYDELENITGIHVRTYIKGKGKDIKGIICESPLRGTNVLFSE